MDAPPTTARFGWGLARALQAIGALQVVSNSLNAASDWRDGSRGGWTVLPVVLVILSLAIIAFVETTIVRVGPERIRWRNRLGRRIDLAFDEVADVRRHPEKKNRVQLVTTDGRVLPLPVQPHQAPEVWRVVLGARPADASVDRG